MKPPQRHQYGVIARPMDPDLISANPLLAFMASLVASLQNDLVTGIQKAWIDPIEWRMIEPMQPILHALETLKDQPFPSNVARDRERCRLRNRLAELEATDCAVSALHDGRLERMVNLMNACSGVPMSPDLFKRRAIALAADPTAFCATERVSRLRAAEVKTRRTAETISPV